jgi:hypothetical protein
MGIISTLLSAELTTTNDSDTILRDYEHAYNIFTPNYNSFAPKPKNWFHIYFEMKPSVKDLVNTRLANAITSDRIKWNINNLPILGILAKTVSLPKIKIDTVKNNQYNKWTLAQTKINYEPISISFWDDTINTILHFWYGYYSFINQDSAYLDWESAQQEGISIPTEWSSGLSTANTSPIYSAADNWPTNFGMDTVDSENKNYIGGVNFFNSIRIFQFNRVTSSSSVDYSEYVLVNPCISSFSCDDLDMSSSEFSTNKMDIEYETLFYNSGTLSGDSISSWDRITESLFDTTSSPLSSTVNNYETTGLITDVTNEITTSVNSGGISSIDTVKNLVSEVSVNNSISNQLLVSTPSSTYGIGGNPPISE